MTEQTELLERVTKVLYPWLVQSEKADVVARAVAPILIAHGRELAEAEIVAWLEQRERDSLNGHVIAGIRVGIQSGGYKENQP